MSLILTSAVRSLCKQRVAWVGTGSDLKQHTFKITYIFKLCFILCKLNCSFQVDYNNIQQYIVQSSDSNMKSSVWIVKITTHIKIIKKVLKTEKITEMRFHWTPLYDFKTFNWSSRNWPIEGLIWYLIAKSWQCYDCSLCSARAPLSL